MDIVGFPVEEPSIFRRLTFGAGVPRGRRPLMSEGTGK